MQPSQKLAKCWPKGVAKSPPYPLALLARSPSLLRSASRFGLATCQEAHPYPTSPMSAVGKGERE
jgi:hypothetical protein